MIWNKLTGNLVGGHQRLKILKSRGDKRVKVSVVSLSKSKEMALNIALNKTGGNWDMPKLKELLIEIDTGEFNMDLTGFGQDELEDLMTQFYEPADIDDLLRELDISEAVEKPIWITVRTRPENQEMVEQACAVLEGAGIRVERSYG